MSYVISTDTTCDFPEEYYQQHDLNVLALSYICILYTSPSPRDAK